ncbi:MAG: hypothetical protein JHC95_07840 [Solirubrobacteraceae bacterium]|nr:hypothetical protein [Solirubrobacteraceae bacterium]
MRALLLGVFVALIAAPAAHGASVAYIDNGSVWISSLDGAQKVKLADPVTNSDGDIEKWLDVAQSDNGRIVAVRNKPGRVSSFNWYKVWEPNGTSTVEGPLKAPSGWFVYVYPVGFDITADGKFLVYGYSNSSSCCPISFGQGTYVRSADGNVLDPIAISGQQNPSVIGNRVVARSGNTVTVQKTPGAPFGSDFTSWLDLSGTGLELSESDVSADGRLFSWEGEQWTGGTQTTGKIGVLSIQGVDAIPALPGAVDCWMPVSGVGEEPSLSQDATRLAWNDGQGLKVAPTPVTNADPCVLPGAPVVISPTGEHGSIGGADVGTFAPAVPAPPGSSTPGGPGGTTSSPGPTGSGLPGVGGAPVVTLPAKAKVSVLAASSGLPIKVKVAGPGKVTVTGTVPAKTLGRKGKPVVVATGSTTAKQAGTVTVKLKLTKAGKAKRKRLKGAKLTVKVKQGTKATTKSVTLG